MANPVYDSSLPLGWDISVIATGRPFYIDHEHLFTTWDHPVKGPIPAPYEERIDTEGRRFYINLESHERTWADPRKRNSKFFDMCDKKWGMIPDVSVANVTCLYCCDILFRPTTTLCGHNFCHECYMRALRSDPVCPACKTRLSLASSEEAPQPNQILSTMIEAYFPERYGERKAAFAASQWIKAQIVKEGPFQCSVCDKKLSKKRYACHGGAGGCQDFTLCQTCFRQPDLVEHVATHKWIVVTEGDAAHVVARAQRGGDELAPLSITVREKPQVSSLESRRHSGFGLMALVRTFSEPAASQHWPNGQSGSGHTTSRTVGSRRNTVHRAAVQPVQVPNAPSSRTSSVDVWDGVPQATDAVDEVEEE